MSNPQSFMVAHFVDPEDKQEFTVWYRRGSQYDSSELNKDADKIFKQMREGTSEPQLVTIKIVTDDCKSSCITSD